MLKTALKLSFYNKKSDEP